MQIVWQERRAARRRAFWSLSAASLALACAAPAQAAAQSELTASPALSPAFDPDIYNYVTRCEPAGLVHLRVTAGATPVSVDGQPAKSGSFRTSVTLATGQRFTVVVGTGSSQQSYNVRCLPSDFPHYSFQQFGEPQAAYYLVTPTYSLLGESTPYVALFDSNGVPVWWYRQPDGIPYDADLTPDGDLSWAVLTDIEPFGEPGTVQVEEHDLNGDLLATTGTVGTPTDLHEAWPQADGDFLIDSYVLRTGAKPGDRNVLDASFQDVRPDGSVAYTWNSDGILNPAESISQIPAEYPGVSGTVWDSWHINSVQPYEDGYLVSMRNADAIYYIDGSTGAVVWKLGGTPTPQSLTIIGDPDGASDFGGQHDARVWPDGTISVLDDGSGRGRPPRVVRFSIDAAARTATLVQTLTDPKVTSLWCCGSARLLPGGDWVVDWGDSGIVDEISPDNQLVARLSFTWPLYTYRAVPILPGQLSPAALVAGMDAMYPRSPQGSRELSSTGPR